MARACLCLALLLACGGNETPESESSTETEGETESSSMRSAARTGGETEGEAAEDEPRPNRSAGPARAGFQLVPQRMHRQFVHRVTVFGRHAAAGTYRGIVTVFDVPSGHVRAARRLFFGPVVHLEASADRKRIFAMGSSAGEEEMATDAVVWDLETDRVWRVPDYNYGTRRAFSPSGEQVASLEEVPEGMVIHLDTVWGGSRTRRVADSSPRAVIFSHDARALYVVDEERVQRHGLPGLRAVGEGWAIPSGGLYPHPTEDLVALATGSSLEIRALADGEVKHTLDSGRDVRGLTWSHDGSRIATCSRASARVFGGDDYATVTDFGHNRCYELVFDLLSETPATVVSQHDKLTYQPAGEGAEALQLEPRLNDGVVGFPTRGEWFLYGSNTDVYIANRTRRRARRLVRGGSGEYSAWSVSAGEDASITLRGRGWHHTFGAEEEAEAREGSSEELEFPEVEGENVYVEHIATSQDGQHRIVVEEPTGDGKPYLLNAGAPRAIALRQPTNGLGVECGMDYDEENGEEGYYCDAHVAFAPDASSFVVGGFEGTASYDLTGRRLGTAPAVSWVRYTPDGSSVVALFRDGALSILGTNLRRKGVVLRAREGVATYTRFNEAGTLLAGVRGAALVIYDVAANARKHMIALPSRSSTAPTFTEDGMVQVQLANAFVWYGIEDGAEARRVEVDDIRGIDESREHVVYCKDDRLRHRVLSDEGEGMDLGPCPHDARELAFDEDRVWWVEGTRGHVVRLSDAEHLIVGVYHSRRPILYAFTPRGHFWTNRPDGLRNFRARAPGPVLDAEASMPEATSIRESLVADYLADRDLGDAE